MKNGDGMLTRADDKQSECSLAALARVCHSGVKPWGVANPPQNPTQPPKPLSPTPSPIGAGLRLCRKGSEPPLKQPRTTQKPPRTTQTPPSEDHARRGRRLAPRPLGHSPRLKWAHRRHLCLAYPTHHKTLDVIPRQVKRG